MYPRKGRIAIGSDADVVVFGRKPSVISRNNHHSNCDFNVFEGLQTEYNPIVVIQAGRVVLDEDGKLTVIQGSGRFIPRQPFTSLCFSRLQNRDLYLGPFKVDRSGQVKDSKNGHGIPSAIQATPPKVIEKPISIVTEIEAGGHSPLSSASSTGSLTPTGFHKTITKSGVRSQQDSNFKITGQQIDDDRLGRTSVKLHQPPGGKSSGLW